MRVLCAKVTGISIITELFFLKEIPWTKSIGLWINERAPVQGSTVDRASYPFRGSNLGHPSRFRRLRADGDEAAAAEGGAAAEPPESHRYGASVC
jgi:hypothetical protein